MLLHAAPAAVAKRDAIDESRKRREYARKNGHDAAHSPRSVAGLSAGRWSLVDHWDTDGKRFVLAMRKCLPGLNPFRRSRPVNGASSALAAMGPAATKKIAYMLGLSQASIARALTHTRTKLNVVTRSELVTVWRAMEIQQRRGRAVILDDRAAMELVESAYDTQLSDEERPREMVAGLGRVAGTTFGGAGVSVSAVSGGGRSEVRQHGWARSRGRREFLAPRPGSGALRPNSRSHRGDVWSNAGIHVEPQLQGSAPSSRQLPTCLMDGGSRSTTRSACVSANRTARVRWWRSGFRGY